MAAFRGNGDSNHVSNQRVTAKGEMAGNPQVVDSSETVAVDGKDTLPYYRGHPFPAEGAACHHPLRGKE